MQIKTDDRAWPYPQSMPRQKRVARVVPSRGVQPLTPLSTLMFLGLIATLCPDACNLPPCNDCGMETAVGQSDSIQ